MSLEKSTVFSHASFGLAACPILRRPMPSEPCVAAILWWRRGGCCAAIAGIIRDRCGCTASSRRGCRLIPTSFWARHEPWVPGHPGKDRSLCQAKVGAGLVQRHPLEARSAATECTKEERERVLGGEPGGLRQAASGVGFWCAAQLDGPRDRGPHYTPITWVPPAGPVGTSQCLASGQFHPPCTRMTVRSDQTISALPR